MVCAFYVRSVAIVHSACNATDGSQRSPKFFFILAAALALEISSCSHSRMRFAYEPELRSRQANWLRHAESPEAQMLTGWKRVLG